MEPGGSEPGGQGNNSLIQLLKNNRALAAVVGGVALVVVVTIVGNLAGDGPEAAATPTTLTASPTTPSTGTSVDSPGHQIPPLDGCTLIPFDDVAVALGIPDDVGLNQLSRNEGCLWQAPDDEPSVRGRLVVLTPGNPDDFGSGATLNDVTGVPVPDLGDLAMWFGGTDTGTVTVVTETDLAYLFMQLSISRPDVTDADRLEMATALMSSAIDTVVLEPPVPIEADLCDLVTDEEAEALLAPHRESRPGAMRDLIVSDNFGETVDLTQSGEYECTKLILTEIYVKVQTSPESDFGDTASLDGVPGVAVPGIGDEAMWFENVPAGGGFASPHEADILAVRWENARFRIVLALPDLGPDEQFDTAKELGTKALGRIPGGPIIVEQEKPDLSNLGYVDNLLAKQDEGEWSYEDGLIATLKLFADEADSGAVLRNPELIDYSGTGIISLAEEYLDTAQAGPAKDEVTRLLDLLIPRFNTTSTPEVSKSLTVALGDLFMPDIVAQEDPAGEEELQQGSEDRGYAPPDDDVPRDYSAPPIEPGECANFEPKQAGWDTSGYELGDYGAWVGAVLFPTAGQEDGWSRETHLLWAQQALTDSIAKYGTPPVCIWMVLSHHGGSYTFVEQRIDPTVCLVFINKPMQARNPEQFKQQLAADIAHCYIPFVFPGQSGATYLARRWWNHALAEYMSNLVYPGVNLEWRLAPAMRAEETTRPLVERGADNWIFFQDVVDVLGEEALGQIILALPGGDNPFFDQLALAEREEMSGMYQTFGEHMTDVSVADTGGGTIPYQPPKITKSLDGPGTHEQELNAFQAARWEVTIPSGQYACITGEAGEKVLVSYRPGKVGSPGGEWAEFPTEETAFNEDFVLVATSVQDGEKFRLSVRDVNEEPDCQKKEEPQTEPPPETCDCDPSSYFLVWQDIPELLQKVLHPGG
ncbi:MAG: hypothetical protein WA726_09055 [Acidimicrobiia bacterium]